MKGTLAIDLGSWTTVVAFQEESSREVNLLDLPPITSCAGEIPSLVWHQITTKQSLFFGQEVIELDLIHKKGPHLATNFKRWIGSPDLINDWSSDLLPEEAGELFIKEIWSRIPTEFEIKRLVLTAPVESYKAYRKWLHKVCSELEVAEIALVDEPTAAAMGAGQLGGSKILVIDLGGSTVDMSMVILQGGEGKADPIAQLVRFNGEDLEDKSKQVLRCAKVIGKAGIQLGGRDIDKWVSNELFPNSAQTESLLNTAEKLKCKLSDLSISDTKILIEKEIFKDSDTRKEFKLSREKLEELLIKKGFLKCLDQIFEKTLAKGRSNGCELTDLTGVIMVGGLARIPLLRKWLENKVPDSKILTPPPIEAVAIGALSLTPGVLVRDLLQHGVSLKCWDQKLKKNIWHPIFLEGQPWPTSKDFEIILGASRKDQLEIELELADYEIHSGNEVSYVKGIPVIKDEKSQTKIIPWVSQPISIELNPPGQSGQDCLKLKFSINDKCQLVVKSIDIRSGEEGLKKELGSLR